MGDEIKANDKPKLEIRRGNVTITSTQRSPIIYNAVEQITWSSGSIQIYGVGIDRQSALEALEVSYAKLLEVLAIAR